MRELHTSAFYTRAPIDEGALHAGLRARRSGRLPALLVQMLCVAGCEPLVAGRAQDVAAIRALGPAVAALDHNAENFALVAAARSGGGRLHAVFDTLGCEEEESLVQEYLDAAPQLVANAASCPV